MADRIIFGQKYGNLVYRRCNKKKGSFGDCEYECSTFPVIVTQIFNSKAMQYANRLRNTNKTNNVKKNYSLNPVIKS